VSDAPRLVLASGSPRRRELLTDAGLTFAVVPADIDESVRDSEDPKVYVQRLAEEKAAAVAAGLGSAEVVLAADTTVDLDGEILAKPAGEDDAFSMLVRLRGRTHQVHTGIAVRRGATCESTVVSASVHFAEASDEDLWRYIATGEPMDKAGAYAIQGLGAELVDGFDGSRTAIIGLPMEETLAMLAAAGIVVPARD
jgi:septum formation protein